MTTTWKDGDAVIYTPSWGSEWNAKIELLPGTETPDDVHCRLVNRRDGIKSPDEGRTLFLPEHALRLASEVLW